MEKRYLTKQLPSKWPFSHGVAIKSPGTIIILAGQVAFDSHGPNPHLLGPPAPPPPAPAPPGQRGPPPPFPRAARRPPRRPRAGGSPGRGARQARFKEGHQE